MAIFGEILVDFVILVLRIMLKQLSVSIPKNRLKDPQSIISQDNYLSEKRQQ